MALSVRSPFSNVLLCVGVLLFVTLDTRNMAQANRPRPSPPPSPPPPPPGCLASCPRFPTTDCDFYFDGSFFTVPTFQLPNSSPRTLGTVKVRSTNDVVTIKNIASTGNGCATKFVSGQSPPGTTGNQFYGTLATIAARTFNSPLPVSAYVPNCVKLPLTSVQLMNGTQAINLNPGVENSAYPESKRCVVFKISG